MVQRFLFVLALAIVAAGPAAHAQTFSEGVDYTVLKTPLATDSPARPGHVPTNSLDCPSRL